MVYLQKLLTKPALLLDKIIIFALFFFSVPVKAEVSPSPLLLSSVTYITGLSIAIIVFSFVHRKMISIKWFSPALLSLIVLSLLFSVAYLDRNVISLKLTLFFSLLLINLLFLWPVMKLSPAMVEAADSTFIKLSFKLVILADISYLILLSVAGQGWYFPAWLLLGSLLQVIAVIRAILYVEARKRSFFLHGGQWLLCFGFIIILFLWLTAKIGLVWLIGSLVLMITLVMINTAYLISELVAAKFADRTDIPVISSEDLFSYTHDPATNLPSYQQALKQCEQVLKQAGNKRFAAIVFKPINFQQVNAVLGHHNSDLLLLQLAYCLQQKVVDNTRLTNFDSNHQPIRLARLQGLNFLVVVELVNTSHPEKAVVNDLCQQLSDAVPAAMSFKSFSLNFELAFGVAFVQGNTNSAAELIAFAGDALLEAESHQQFICYFDNSTTLYTEQQLLKMERLKQDLHEENLRWYLQPQIALADKSIKGFELMVHWYCEADVALELYEFIDVAEQSGEIHLLTKNMIVQAFRILAQLQQLGIYQPLSINITSKELLETELVDFIELQSNIFTIQSKYLIIELTESVMLSASARAKSFIDQLKALDINIAIDQFSGSYESLRYLRKMAVDQVKINCRRLSEQGDNRADKAIVNALINLTRSMGLPMIGTGIDTPEVEKIFTVMGGEIAQGKVINRGVVPDELAIWLKRWSEKYPDTKA